MKVFLGNPPWISGERRGVRAGSRWPFTVKLDSGLSKPRYIPFPFFLAYATAVLEKAGHTVKLVDGIADGMTTDEFQKEIDRFKPDLVVMETSTGSIHIDLATAKEISDKGYPTALCGPHASVMAKQIMEENPHITYVMCGEYEYTLLELAEHLQKGKPLKGVKGLCFRAAGKVEANPRRPLIEDVNGLPWPARHQLHMMNYVDAFAGLPIPTLQMWASRGCPYKCIFCLWPKVMYGSSSYRPRDPVLVVDEMEAMIKEYKFKSVYFDDDTFNIGDERMRRFCQEVKRRGIDVPWAVMARADTSDFGLLKEMADAGMYAIKFGVESGCQELVNNAHKNLDLKQVEKTVEYTKKLGVKTHLTFTFGLPGETWDTVRRTIEFVARLKPDSVQFSIATPFPGTDYFEELQKNGLLLTRDWKNYDGTGSAVFRTQELSPEDLKKACQMAQDSWIYRKRSAKDIARMFSHITQREGISTTARRFVKEGPRYIKHQLKRGKKSET